MALLGGKERLMPYYDIFISSTDSSQRQWALCIMDDMLEFCGPESFKYQAHFIEPIMLGLEDGTPANRQAAAYGVGMAAKNGGEVYAEFVAACIPKLFQVTQHPRARDDDHVFATENACASIAKILQFNNSRVPDPQSVVENWVKTLPVVFDEMVAPYAYLFLVHLIEQKNPAVLRNITHVVVSVLEALDSQSLTGRNAGSVINAMKGLLLSAGPQGRQILLQLPADKQNLARKFLA